jgi:hypothetical protein
MTRKTISLLRVIDVNVVIESLLDDYVNVLVDGGAKQDEVGPSPPAREQPQNCYKADEAAGTECRALLIEALEPGLAGTVD